MSEIPRPGYVFYTTPSGHRIELLPGEASARELGDRMERERWEPRRLPTMQPIEAKR
jgi:hypothetical protein